MKLLFDQSLSFRLTRSLANLYPGSVHVRDLAMADADDTVVWNYALQHGFTIVSKDSDFFHRSLVFGHPPKVIWIRVGNCSTAEIEALLRNHHADLLAFEKDPVASFLTLA